MNPEQWQQIKDLFDSVIQQDPAQRDHLLDQACGEDAVLRSEIMSLVASQSDSDSFFETLESIRERALEDAFGYLHPGATVAHYRILEKIGEGGMGEVYKAEDLKLKRIVALKILCASARKQEDTRQRLLREARTAATLHHQNVVTIFSIEETKDSDFIVMEYVEGETLKRRLDRGPLALGELTGLALQVCEALAAAHAIGLVHRDIKPENILMNTQEKVKVVDFGLAKKIVSGERDLTGPGIIAGTVCYMSPEQVKGQPLDQQTDIFSLGCVLYRAATGKLPFEGANLLSTMDAISSVEPVPPSRIRQNLPPEVDRILFRALAKSKDGRYSSVQELAKDLRSLCDAKLPVSCPIILFVEVVDPILTAVTLGSAEWQKVIGNFRETTTQKLREFNGNQVALDNSGVLARFENPDRAISCASAVLKAAEGLKMPARAALHIERTEQVGAELIPALAGRRQGLPLQVTVRICGEGAVGEILCSNDFRNAAAGIGFAFRDRGTLKLKKSKPPVKLFAIDQTDYPSRPQTVAGTGRVKSVGRRMFIYVAAIVIIVATFLLFPTDKSAVPISSVAVLPFTSVSVNPNVQYFSDAMTDTLISQLSQVPGLKVMARGTVFSYKGREVDPRTVGRNLKVDAVVTGSIFHQGETLFIYADLVRVTDGTVIWSEEYSRKIADLLVLHQEISKAISTRFKLENKIPERRSGGE